MSKQQPSSHTVNLDELSSSSVETAPQNVHADEAQQQQRRSNSSTLSSTVSSMKHDHGKKAHKYLVRDESMTMGAHNAQHAEASTSASASTTTTTTTKAWVTRASSSLGNTLVRHSHIILPTLVVLCLVAAVVLFSLGIALRNAYAPHVPPYNNNSDTHSSTDRHHHHSNDNSDNNGHRGNGDDNCSHHHPHRNNSDRYTDYDSSSSTAPMPATMTPYKDSSNTSSNSSSSSNNAMHSSSAMLPYPDMPSSSNWQYSDKDDHHDDDDDRDDHDDDDDDRDDDEHDKYYLDGMCSCMCTRARCCRNFGFDCPSDKRYCDRYNTYCTCNCSPQWLWDKRPQHTGCREKYKRHMNMCKAPYPFQDHNLAMCRCNCELVDDNFTTCVHACRCKY